MAPSHMDVRLDWLIARSGIEQADAFRRLNAIENRVANLGSQWRAWRPIEPARELRMCEATRDALLAWVEARRPALARVQHVAHFEFKDGKAHSLRPRLLKTSPEEVAYLDAQEVSWRVYERDARRDPGAHLPACLIFESREAIRRVWVYPRDWRTLDAVALEALSWHR